MDHLLNNMVRKVAPRDRQCFGGKMLTEQWSISWRVDLASIQKEEVKDSCCNP